MTKKQPHHLEGLNTILGSLKGDAPSPSSPMSGGFRGRPSMGKKSDEAFCQTTISIRKATRKQVKQVLLDAENGQDVSELVEELLVQWLKSH